MTIPARINGRPNPAYHLAYYYKTAEIRAAFNRARHQRKRAALLRLYGGDPPRCACCGEAREPFLAIDHERGDGGEHRRTIGRGSVLVNYLLREKRAGVRVLCHNCNQARGQYGRCPHETEA